MHFHFKILLAAVLVSVFLASANAQTRHVIPNRGLYPENGGLSGLGGSSMGLQTGASVQPATVPKTITITGTYREVRPPTVEESKAKELKTVASQVSSSLQSPLIIQFTPEQFERLAIELVRKLYVTNAIDETLSFDYDLEERNGEIIKIKKSSVFDKNEPTTELLLQKFEAGESFLVLRKTPFKTTCGMCDGKGTVKIGEITYDNNAKPTESRFAECPRCKGLKRTTVDVDMLYKVVPKKAE